MDKMFSYWCNLIGGVNLVIICSYSINKLKNILLETKMLKAWEVLKYCTEVNDEYIRKSVGSNYLAQQTCLYMIISRSFIKAGMTVTFLHKMVFRQ